MEKTPETFTSFTMSLISADTELKQSPLLDKDLEKAVFNGFKPRVPILRSFVCVKYRMDRDMTKLCKIGAKR